MNKRIVFCEHAVETLTYFSRQLAQAFEAWGYEIFWINIEMAGLGAWKLRQAVKEQKDREKETVLLTFNFIGLSGEEALWELDDFGQPVVSLWERLGIRCLNIMVDHPIYYDKAMQYPLPDVQMFCVDRDHVYFMKRFYPKLPCEFLPLAGNCLGKDADVRDWHGQDARQREAFFAQWEKRPYPLVFTANYVPIANITKRLDQLEPEYRDFYYEVIQSFLQDPSQDLLSCMESFLRREIPDLSDAQLCEGMSSMPAVDLWVRTYFREKTVRILADGGVDIHLFGKDWDQVSCRRPQHLIFTSRMVTSAECVQAMAQAKLALNTMPWFKDGAHDRIFTAMLQGAAALTDDSRYLREQFTDRDTVAYYDLQDLEALPQQVLELLADPQRLYDISCRGNAVARQYHQWENRAKVLEQYM